MQRRQYLVQQYSAAIGFLSQTNHRRTMTARFYISLTSGLIALLTFAFRPGVEIETQLLIINIISGVSILLSGVWYMTVKSLTRLAEVQRNLLKEMETHLPFDFITKQETELLRTSRWIRTGLIEQYLPLVMMIPAAILLILANVS